MRTSVTVLTLLFASLLLIAGCGGGEKGSTTSEDGQATQAEAPPETTPTTTGPGAPETTLAIINSLGERVIVRVEVADTNEERARGLMERTELAEDAGMLFVLDRPQSPGFWMRNTLIPLTVAYISADGRIVDIQDMQPLDETSHPSAEPAKYALEVNQGFFAERGIEVGDMVEIPREYR